MIAWRLQCRQTLPHDHLALISPESLLLSMQSLVLFSILVVHQYTLWCVGQVLWTWTFIETPPDGSPTVTWQELSRGFYHCRTKSTENWNIWSSARTPNLWQRKCHICSLINIIYNLNAILLKCLILKMLRNTVCGPHYYLVQPWTETSAQLHSLLKAWVMALVHNQDWWQNKSLHFLTPVSTQVHRSLFIPFDFQFSQVIPSSIKHDTTNKIQQNVSTNRKLVALQGSPREYEGVLFSSL